jgi:hypothetical protein
MSQQARKEQEAAVVRRLTAGAGAAALGLAGYFTAAAVTAVPVALGAPAGSDQPVVGMEQIDDHVFVRTVHVPAPRPPAGGVRAAPAGAGPTTTIAQSVAAAPAPAPTARPVATTGGSVPRK